MIAGDAAHAHIYEPGNYRVIAELPTGWIATTPETLQQELAFEAFDRAGSGMVPKSPCEHIGLGPELTISGRIDAPNSTSVDDISITAYLDGAPPVAVAFDGAGHYRLAAKAGNWRVVVRDKTTGQEAFRAVTVKNDRVAVSTITLGETQRNPREFGSTLVSFDDLLSSDALLEIPSGYRGLKWKYWVATHERLYGGPGYVNGTVSGEYMAYNSSGVPASIASDDPFYLHGLYMTAAWSEGEHDDVIVRGWLNDNLVFEDSLAIETAGPVYFQADYDLVDRVDFSHALYERIVIDNLVYSDR